MHCTIEVEKSATQNFWIPVEFRSKLIGWWYSSGYDDENDEDEEEDTFMGIYRFSSTSKMLLQSANPVTAVEL